MSVRKVHLRKLLQLFYLPENELTTKLREDIRQDISKLKGNKKSGGDFHVGFWSDAMRHAKGEVDLQKQTVVRIRGGRGRERLYPLLTKGFLEWWDEKRRWRNEPFSVIDVDRIKGNYVFDELGAVVKVENLLCVQVGDMYKRLIYPYFSESPALSEDAARLGLWLIGETLKEFPVEDNRILDVLRSNSYGISDSKIQGDERLVFTQKYKLILDKWDQLRLEYE